MPEIGNVSSTLVFFVNGKKVVDSAIDPEWTLLYYLRNKLRLCGTKLGCAEGGCGACTVMVSKVDRTSGTVSHLAVNACLAPVAALHGLAVTTIEGIGSTKTRLHPVQERLALAHGSQCGFCTPGIIMSVYALLRTKAKPNMTDMEIALQGNLCRCTGYRPILEGLRTFTEEWEQLQMGVNGLANGLTDPRMSGYANSYVNGHSDTKGQAGAAGSPSGPNGSPNGSPNGCAMGDQCCKRTGKGCGAEAVDEPAPLFNVDGFTPWDPSQEPIFPPQLKLSDELDRQTLVIKGPRATWYRPTTMNKLLDLKDTYNHAKIIVGNTEVGVETKFKGMLYPVLIFPSQIPEMTSVTQTENGVRVGASVTISNMETALREQIAVQPEYKTRIYSAILEMTHYFAGRQIRNAGAVGGNIMTGSPISDLIPCLMAFGCELELRSKERGVRTVPLDHTFFTGYRRNVVHADEILLAMHFPYSTKDQYFEAFKQAKRRDDDIAIVNCAMNVTFEPGTTTIQDINVAYGGMAPSIILARKTREVLIGRNWDDGMLDDAYKALISDLPLPANAPGGMIQYRSSLTLSLFFKGYLRIRKKLSNEARAPALSAQLQSAPDKFHSKPPKSSQYYFVERTGERVDSVGQPKVHASAFKQATGEAQYCDDIPFREGELYLALVMSQRAHARLVSVDPSAAVAHPGVHLFLSAKDLPSEHNNTWGPITHDEYVFAPDVVTAFGQVIGAIVADDQITAQRAAKLVKIEYEDLPTIVTIKEAIEANSFHIPPKSIRFGDVDAAFENADHVLEGEVHIGGQEHFYLETQACIAIPKLEDDELEIISSTQNPSETQKLVAHMLGIPSSRVVCKVKRLGGGFGGKESKANILSLPCALAAQKLGRPVRCMLDRDEDMVLSGTRHPFYSTYQIAFSSDGRFLGAKVKIYNNAGNTLDLSPGVMDRAMVHFNNAYFYPAALVSGYVCKTNLPSNTAFRGFGGPQGMLVSESIVRRVAHYLGKDPVEIAEKNLFNEGDSTHYNQILENCTIKKCWRQVLRQSHFYIRQRYVNDFNKQHRYRKRGLAVVPTQFGIAFTALHLNQAGALVLIYNDGSVLLSHGGTEMGQGLHTKMIQVAARALQIPESYIHISETSTDKVPNTSPSAASASSDLNGMAVLNACAELNERLKPIKEANPKGKWETWIHTAYMNRISLAASGFYKTPDISYDFATNSGQMFNYYTIGAAVSEVEIDCLTGDHQVLRTDIVMDLGESLNPAIDIGQIEGGFIQGYGLMTMEELVYSPKGIVMARGPGVYKLPGFADIPNEFNVALLKGAPNPRAVYSSKAVGEPPVFLASSIFFALYEAIRAAREAEGHTEYFEMESPATSARIRMACQDSITAKFPAADPKTYTPWNTTVA